MPHVEVIPNSTSQSAPGWAYVPDNGYDPSKVAIQPSGVRKRAARASALAIGDTTTRQQSAILKHLAELDKDNHRDVHIAVPSKQKEIAGKGKLPRSPHNFRTKNMSCSHEKGHAKRSTNTRLPKNFFQSSRR